MPLLVPIVATGGLTLWLTLGARDNILMPALTETYTAQMMTILGSAGFTATWSAFLIVANHFSHWFCPVAVRNTHFHLTLWGWRR